MCKIFRGEDSSVYRGISENRGWMVYNGKPYWNGWFGGTTIFGNTHRKTQKRYMATCDLRSTLRLRSDLRTAQTACAAPAPPARPPPNARRPGAEFSWRRDDMIETNNTLHGSSIWKISKIPFFISGDLGEWARWCVFYRGIPQFHCVFSGGGWAKMIVWPSGYLDIRKQMLHSKLIFSNSTPFKGVNR